MSRLGGLDDVVAALRGGGLGAFPTETLWSLSADARDPATVAKVFAAKKRPTGMPLAVGFPSWTEAKRYVRASRASEALAKRFLPGPLSLVLERKDETFRAAAPGVATLSVRVPDHPLALAVLEQTGPVVMTSANAHGEADPRTAADVVAALPETDVVVLDYPDAVPGTGSTVVDATGDRPRVLREGMITEEQVVAAWP